MAKEPKWRKYLNGSYVIDDPSTRNQMDFNIRQKAKQMIKDLVLICDKMPYPDRVRIFYGRGMFKAVDRLAWQIQNNTALLTSEMGNYYEISEIARGLEVFHIRYDSVRLKDDEVYRSNMKLFLYSDDKRKERMEAWRKVEKEKPLSPINEERTKRKAKPQ